MKPASGKIMDASLRPEARANVVRLPETGYSSVDSEKLGDVRRLLLDEAAKPGPPYVVLDLSAVQFFGVAFLGLLVYSWSELTKRKRQLVLCGLTPFCASLIRISHLDKLFDIHPTQRDALEQIGPHVSSADGAKKGPSIRVRKSAVAWDPHMVRLEYIAEDDVPIRTT